MPRAGYAFLGAAPSLYHVGGSQPNLHAHGAGVRGRLGVVGVDSAERSTNKDDVVVTLVKIKQ